MISRRGLITGAAALAAFRTLPADPALAQGVPGLTPFFASAGKAPQFDPAFLASGVTLSNTNRTASFASPGSTRSLQSVNAGSLYVEVTVSTAAGTVYIGIGNATLTTGSLPANNANGASYASGGALWTGTTQTTGASYTTGDVIGMHLNFGTGIRFYKNGVAQGANLAFPSGGGPWFLFVSMAGTGTSGLVLTINTSAQYALPSGASYWTV